RAPPFHRGRVMLPSPRCAIGMLQIVLRRLEHEAMPLAPPPLEKGRSPSAARRVGISARRVKVSPPGPPSLRCGGPTSPFQGEVGASGAAFAYFAALWALRAPRGLA